MLLNIIIRVRVSIYMYMFNSVGRLALVYGSTILCMTCWPNIGWNTDGLISDVV